MRARNIGWRIDYVLATGRLAGHVRSITVQREFGTSGLMNEIMQFLDIAIAQGWVEAHS